MDKIKEIPETRGEKLPLQFAEFDWCRISWLDLFGVGAGFARYVGD